MSARLIDTPTTDKAIENALLAAPPLQVSARVLMVGKIAKELEIDRNILNKMLLERGASNGEIEGELIRQRANYWTDEECQRLSKEAIEWWESLK